METFPSLLKILSLYISHLWDRPQMLKCIKQPCSSNSNGAVLNNCKLECEFHISQNQNCHCPYVHTICAALLWEEFFFSQLQMTLQTARYCHSSAQNIEVLLCINEEQKSRPTRGVAKSSLLGMSQYYNTYKSFPDGGDYCMPTWESLGLFTLRLTPGYHLW